MAADEMAPSLQFPAGLKILAVDDDNTVLEIIKQMCTRCSYHVTTCGDSSLALNLVRERKGFDLLLIDVHMPNMDGYDFLQRVIQEQINVPVIMMSVDGATSAVYKAIKLGACDYWVKPLREESFKNMWHHVVRKDNNNNNNNNFASLEEDDDGKKHGGSDGSEFVSSVVDATTSDVDATKRSNAAEADVDESDNCYQPPTKKPRVVWSTQLHKKFVRAVTELGLDKAVPKRILELMNEPGLTRENVASHLQKYRLYLKRSEVMPPQQNNGMQLANTTTESMLDASRNFEFQALDASSNVPYETLAGLHANMMPNAEQAITYPPHPLAKCPPNIIPNNFPQSIMRDDTSTRYGAWLPCSTVVDSEKLKNHLLMDSLQQQQMMQQHQQIRSVNPCMVVPPYITQNCGFGRGSAIDYGLLSSNNSLGVAQFPGERNIARGFVTPTSISRLLQSSSLTSGSIPRRPFLVPETQIIPYGSICYQESPKTLGCDGKDTCIASKSAGLETILSSLGRNENVSKDIDDNRTKEEPNSMNSPKENHNLV